MIAVLRSRSRQGQRVWRSVRAWAGAAMARWAAVAAPARSDDALPVTTSHAQAARGWLARHGLLRYETLIGLLAAALSIGFSVWYAEQGLTLAYGDAISHMSIAYRVFASRNPGLAQLGTVWPPLNHIFMLPFVWNQTLYRSGLGGTIPSMIAYVVAAVYMYRTGALVFGSWRSGMVAALTLMLNPSVLYMQATPMSEMDLICFAVVAVYYASRWSATLEAPDLTKCAAAVAAGTLIRYDGWALAVALLVIIVAIAWIKRGRVFAEACALLYSTLAFAGCVAWLIYEQVIFGNMFDFLTGPYSAKAQEVNIKAQGGLLTSHNPLLSLHVYAQVMIEAAGLPLVLVAALGLAWWAWRTRRMISTWPVFAVLVPFGFNWLSLVLGITTITTPEVPTSADTPYFNVRYGMMMLPAIALFVAALTTLTLPIVPTTLANLKRLFKPAVLMTALLTLVLGFACVTFLFGTPLALQDPIDSAKTPQYRDVISAAQWLDTRYHGGVILASTGAFDPMIFDTGLPTRDFISDGDGSYFHAAVDYPQEYVEWIVMNQRSNNYEAVWAALHVRTDWQQYYVLRATYGTIVIYQRIDTPAAASASHSPPQPAAQLAFQPQLAPIAPTSADCVPAQRRAIS